MYIKLVTRVAFFISLQITSAMAMEGEEKKAISENGAGDSAWRDEGLQDREMEDVIARETTPEVQGVEQGTRDGESAEGTGDPAVKPIDQEWGTELINNVNRILTEILPKDLVTGLINASGHAQAPIVANATAEQLPPTTGEPVSKAGDPPVVDATQGKTIAVLKWADSFLALEAPYLELFLSGNEAPMVGERKPYVIWNGRDGICRLVPFNAIRGACKRPTPDVAFLSHRNTTEIFENMFREIYPNNIDVLARGMIVGLLDSHSPSSSALERRSILVHKLNVPTDIYQRALGASLRITDGAKADSNKLE